MAPRTAIVKRSTPAERILKVADKLFYQDGIRAIGVDRLIAESGVAKASFYRAFPSKDDLVAAWLDVRDQQWRAWLQATVDQLAPRAQDKPLAVFDALDTRFRLSTFRGCAFINTITELARLDHPGAHAARRHKESVKTLLASLLKDAGYKNFEPLAVIFLQLIDGAIVAAVREGKPDAALRAKQLAELTLAAQPKKSK